MRQVISDALDVVFKSLGIPGRGSPVTEFDDGNLQQNMDVGALVRRGRTAQDSTGIFTGALRNVHTDAETILSTTNPYNITVGRIAPYPTLVELHTRFDIWLLGCIVSRISGGGTLTGAVFVDPHARAQGWGEDDSGVAVVSAPSMPVAYYDSIVDQSGEFALQNGGNPYQAINMRLRGSDTLIRFSSTSSLTSTYQAFFILGVFPVGLGQDIAI